MLLFYLIDAIINFILAVACFLRFRQYRSFDSKPYLRISLAAFAAGTSSMLLCFLGDGFETLNAVFIYVSLIIYMFSSLVYVLTIVYLLRTWLASMRNAPRPRAHKLARAQKTVRVFTFLYPIFTFILIVFFILLIVTLMWAAILALTVGVLYTLCMIFQIGIIVWLWLDVQVVANETEFRKRNQLIRLGALTFWAAWPSLLSGAGAGIGSSVCWWIWFGIVLWPKALIGYNEEPTATVPGAYGNVSSHPGYGDEARYEPSSPSSLQK